MFRRHTTAPIHQRTNADTRAHSVARISDVTPILLYSCWPVRGSCQSLVNSALGLDTAQS